MAAFEEYFALVDAHELVESSDYYQPEEEEHVFRILAQRANQRGLPLWRGFDSPEQQNEHRCRQQ